MRNFLFIAFLLFSTSLSAQDMVLSGKIVDINNEPLPGAHISLNHPWGEVYKNTISNADGIFTVENIGKGGYQLKVSFLGFTDFITEVTFGTENKILKPIQLLESSLDLGEVEVTEKIPLATQHGDTTSYNADAYKTLPDATAEDLISKMPGVVVENGQVQAQGEDVKEVLVDGRPFFGNDPTAALRNLPAEVVGKIEVFDQSSDQTKFTGFEDGNTTKTINIITRPEFRNGQFGKVYAGYGYEDRYQGGGNASLFDGDRRISIIAQSNNINQQNFASEDLLGVTGGGGGRGGGRRGGGGPGGRGSGGGGASRDFLVQQQDGIALTHALGINYSDRWGEKIEIAGSYFFNWSDTETAEKSTTLFFDNQLFNEVYSDENNSQTINQNHRISARFEYQIDSLNSFIMRPRLSVQFNDGRSATLGNTKSNTLLVNLTENNYQSNLMGIDFSNNLLFRHRFRAKRGRTFSLNLRGAYKNQAGDSQLNTTDIFFRDTTREDFLDQQSDLNITGWNLASSVSFTEPINDKSRIEIQYKTSIQEDDSDKQTKDFNTIDQDYNLINETLSNVFENYYLTNSVGLGYSFSESRDLMFSARASVQRSDLNSDEIFPNPEIVKRTYYNVLPFAMLRYNISRSENIRLFYRSNTENPSVEQLQSVVNNTNPLQLSVGNPNLDQSYSHMFFGRYSKTNTEKATIFYVMFRGTLTSDYISNRTYLARDDSPLTAQYDLPRGAQITQPVNLNGYGNLRLYTTYGIPIKKIKCNLNFDGTYAYSRIPGLVGELKNLSNNQSLGLGFTLSSNISDKVDFTISTRSNFNTVVNSIQKDLNENYLNQVSHFKFGWVMPGGIVFRTNMTHQFYDGLSEGFDQSYFLWTAGIGKKLFKNQRGELTLSVFDILNQNQSISRNITEIYIEDIQTKVLQRYFMLTFTYNFKNYNSGKQSAHQLSEEERREKRRQMRGW